jgi:hypothetical protein
MSAPSATVASPEAKFLPAGSPETADSLSKGLADFLKPIVVECDNQIKSVFESQVALSDTIDELTARSSWRFSFNFVGTAHGGFRLLVHMVALWWCL